jgi:hypothetical protein
MVRSGYAIADSIGSNSIIAEMLGSHSIDSQILRSPSQGSSWAGCKGMLALQVESKHWCTGGAMRGKFDVRGGKPMELVSRVQCWQ